ncbi:bifunctional histidinol-phosphatase/imidazoleglycerol-phosphate dehydratase HisB [Portibacter marinus]|uniref:bifunctional histidinol-phosphatase/imidazoleglycerol-phosphate dehydratase HisB n=1 Tax=Portibacter marinus TaxID=2898660 RepID=UPI001F1E5CEC|nr:bifunctional histidinol-phosphatase/imidazoleglycerol-phosphate dehydratase HisB [Portibacter marinus]
MKSVLFLDRDGVLAKEPPIDFQLDSLEKLEFMPGVLRYLPAILEKLDFEVVMVTNQDGLGTDSFPEHTFWPAHHKILKALEQEGVNFDDIYIDRSFEHENKNTRKPGTGMLTKYLEGDYDLASSFVVGDRLSDMRLADNLGAQGILINKDINITGNFHKCDTWKEIHDFLVLENRTIEHQRNTKETEIKIVLNLDGSGQGRFKTGLGFFDHMLEQISKHGAMDLQVDVSGDLQVDEHHTIEDTGIALGEAFLLALGNKLGIERYGYMLPMDDCLAQVAIDFGGRPWIVWDAEFNREKIGDMPTEMFFHFFKSFSDASKCNLNIKAEGNNEHHKIEAIFKAFARAIRKAVKRDPEYMVLPSTKGSL